MIPEVPLSSAQRYKQFQNTETIWKTTKVGQHNFNLPNNYILKTLVGSGAYGAVAGGFCLNPVTQVWEKVAVKKMTNVFQHCQIAKRILREIKLLRLLNHENIIKIITIILPRSRSQFNDLYVVFQFMDIDLKQLLNTGQQLSQDHYKSLIYQLVSGIKYLHSVNVVHRDIKLRNILVDENCNLKICDFGLARRLNQPEDIVLMTDYVVTRYYRAPQLLIGQHNYDPGIDMWSIGCIIPQLILKKVIFAGTDTIHQFKIICQFLEPEDLNKLEDILQKKCDLFNKNTNYGNSQQRDCGMYFLKIVRLKKNNVNKDNSVILTLNKMQPQAVDLTKKMLVFDQKKRITASEALEHPFLQKFRKKQTQIFTNPIDPLQFEFDQKINITIQQFKDMIYEQILLYHNSDFKKTYFAKIHNKQSIISHIMKGSNTF